MGCCRLDAVLFPDLVFGQEPAKPLTVCEVLANAKTLTGKLVAVMGRLDCPFNLIENPCWLVEDHCAKPAVFRGQVWPNKIWIATANLATSKSSFEVEPAVLRETLAALRKTTSLGTHRIMRLQKKYRVLVPDKRVDVPDEWGLAYGRIVIERGLQHNSGAALALRIDPHDLRNIKDGDEPAAEPKKVRTGISCDVTSPLPGPRQSAAVHPHQTRA